MKSPRKSVYGKKMFKNRTSTTDGHVKGKKLKSQKDKKKTITEVTNVSKEEKTQHHTD